MIVVDKSSGTPLYRQIYESAKETISAGDWRPGETLPSIRSLMSDLGVGRNTVLNAYQQLCAEGYVDAVRGSGYVVADFAELMPPIASAGPPDTGAGAIKNDNPTRTWRYDFYYGNLVAGSFPIDAWRKAAADVLCQANSAELTSYAAADGDWELRAEIARYLGRSRGVRCSPAQVVVTSGTQQSMALVLSLFNAGADAFAMEDPGYDGVRRVALDLGFSVRAVRADAGSGSFLEDVANSGASLLYTTPSHQMPTGTFMRLDIRAGLLSLAAEKGMYVLEDDYDSEYRFDMMPLPSLQSIDRTGHVIYLGTFSKVLTPALRLSYVVLPRGLADAHARRRAGYYATASWIEQRTLALFMRDGQWDRHVRRATRAAKGRHAELMRCIAELLGDGVEVIGDSCGLHVLLQVENGMGQDGLIDAAAARDVRVCPTRGYWMNPGAAPDNLVMLGFSAIPESDIRDGVRELAKAWL